MGNSPALAVLMELRSRAVLDRMGPVSSCRCLYARGMPRVWEKIESIAGNTQPVDR